MPFYEYQCRACGEQTEVLQKITDAPLRKCPSCGKSQLVKLVSAPVFRLKGGGWYETDFKSDGENKRNLAGAEKDDAAPKAAEGDKPAEKKAEGEAAAKPVADKAAKPAATAPAKKPVRKPAAKVAKPAARAKRASAGKARR